MLRCRACKREAEDMIELARSEAARIARLKSRGIYLRARARLREASPMRRLD
jgi:hypothetical protein